MSPKLRSLTLRTDLALASFEGEVLDRPGYVVVRTPHNPAYIWGNFLIFDDAPGDEDVDRWEETFAAEFSDLPVTHRAFTWDLPGGASGHVDTFVHRGYQADRTVGLTAQKLHKPARDPGARMRPLRGDEEWAAAVEIAVACRQERFEETAYRPYKVAQMAAYRRMVEAGRGEWFGAWIEDELVADLGLFRADEGRLARYQMVETAKQWRRRGLCSALVWHAGMVALQDWGAEELVIAADADYHALDIYRRLGFGDREQLWGLEWMQ